MQILKSDTPEFECSSTLANSKYSFYTGNISITWELIRNVVSLARSTE